MRGKCDTGPHPPSPTHYFSAESCARIFGALLLVDSRALREMRVLSSSHIQKADPINAKFCFSRWIKSPSVGLTFSSFLHILSLKQYNSWISMISMKRQIILQLMLVDWHFFKIFKIIGSSVIYFSSSEIPIWTHQRQCGLKSSPPWNFFMDPRNESL